MKVFSLYTDGGSRHNPGPAAAAWIIKDPEGQLLQKGGQFLGRTTNNEAEYRALIGGLRAMQTLDCRAVKCFLDSALVVNQLNGVYKTKEPRLKKLLSVVKDLEQQLAVVSYHYIPRAENKGADKIVNQIIDEHTKN